VTDAPLAPGRPPIGMTLAALLRADFTVLARTPQVLVTNLAVPIIFIVATSFGKRDFAEPGTLIGLALSYGTMSAGMLGYSTLVAQDRASGVFQRLRVTPTPSWAIMASRIVVQLVSAVVMTVLGVVVGSIAHGVVYEWHQYLAVLGVSLLGAAMFLCTGQAIVGLLRSPASVNAVGRVLFILLIISGILGSIGVLGDWFTVFSQWTPVGALTSLYAVAFGAAWSDATTAGAIMVPVYAVVCAFVGIRFFRWESR